MSTWDWIRDEYAAAWSHTPTVIGAIVVAVLMIVVLVLYRSIRRRGP